MGAVVVQAGVAGSRDAERDPEAFVRWIWFTALATAATVLVVVPFILWDRGDGSFSVMALWGTDWRWAAVALSYAVPAVFFVGGYRGYSSGRRLLAAIPVMVLVVGLFVLDVVMRVSGSPTCGSHSCVGILPITQLRFLIWFLPLTLLAPQLARACRSRARPWLVCGAVVCVLAGDVARVWAVPPLHGLRLAAPLALCALVWIVGDAWAEGSLGRVDPVTVMLVGAGSALTTVVSLAVWPYGAYVAGGVPTVGYLTAATAWVSAIWLCHYVSHAVGRARVRVTARAEVASTVTDAPRVTGVP